VTLHLRCEPTRCARRSRRPRVAATLALALGLVACAGGPPPADWQVNAQSAIERANAAYLAGNNRVEAVEAARARSAIALGGRPEVLARAELVRCAARVASLVFEPCAGFEAVRVDALPPEQAYADYLAGRIAKDGIALLPEAQRAVASALAGGSDATAAVQAVADPLSRLVAAGVALQMGRASPAVLVAAIDAASAQGWPRPLLAWLGAQAASAERAGDAAAAQRARRRMQQMGSGP
jgi:hypothetical protein